MSLSNMLPTVWPVFTDGWRRGWNWCRSHGQSLAIAFSCGLALWLALIVYQSSFHKELVILAGPAGSSSWRSADRIASELRNTPRIPGVNYVVRVEATNGLEEIAGRITSDRQGEVIGFSQNRLNPPDRMSMLLPLDYDYLHILCRARFLIESAPGLDVKNFGALLPSIEPGKVFAGPPGSGTRVLAERILARYGRDEAELQELLHPAIDDWLEARAALKSGRVDLVFYSGPIGATTIEDIAVKDKSAVLIGLEDIQSALMRHENYSYRPVKFPLNAYSAEPWDFAPGGFAAQVKLQFCPAELKTIAARRLLVCSSDMPPDDAFLIAKAAQSALASDGNIIGDWKAAPPDVLAVAPPEDSLGVTAHPGAIFVRD
jgi:hypothetical protein